MNATRPTTRKRGLCCHCKRDRLIQARGLCKMCHDKPDVRERYPAWYVPCQRCGLTAAREVGYLTRLCSRCRKEVKRG